MEIWEQAVEHHKNGQYQEAENLYDQLLTQNHANAGLLATVGTLYLQQNKIGLATALLEASLVYGKARPADVLSNLGICYRSSGQQDKAVKYLNEAVACKEVSPQALANYAALYLESPDQEKGAIACRKALRDDPELPIAHWNLALMELAQGKWATAWDHHEYGLRCTPMMRVDRQIGGLPYWNGEKGRVIVYGEQGIGDEIMFASMLPDLLKTNDVIIECHKRLGTLFKKSFPGLTVYPTRESNNPDWVANETADYRLSIGSLGKHYRRSREAFPGTAYLRADPLPKGKKFRVGISWTGGMKAGRVQKRSVPLSWWKSILNVPDVEFVSLQYTDQKEEIDLVNTMGYDVKVMDEYAKADDYYECARLVASCDLVISVCTSVIHLAGALGVPCWVMTPKHPAWRYGNEGGMPWYRSVRLYRAPAIGTDAWMPVVQRIGSDLDDLVHQKAVRLVA